MKKITPIHFGETDLIRRMKHAKHITREEFMEKKQHGGYRPGSGRPKGEEKVRMWIPVSKIEKVKKLINPKNKTSA